MNSARAYKLEQLRFQYPGSGFVLHADDLEIESGKIIALVGPNGSGKTTMLMLMGLLLKPSAGTMEFLGQNPWADGRLLDMRRKLALVTHYPYLFRGTIYDNLVFGLKVRGMDRAGFGALVRETLSMVELEDFAQTPVSALSAGQVQRVALARAMILKPKVLLLDEPTANIDAGMSQRMEAVITELNSRYQTTIIFSTHNFSQAFRLADKVLHFSDGKQVNYSHENFFSGKAETDGKLSWIEPKPGARIVFSGEYNSHITCIITPEKIKVFSENEAQRMSGPNLFSGTVIRLELVENNQALVRVSGELNFRLKLSIQEIEQKKIAISRKILLRFPPEAVEVL